VFSEIQELEISSLENKIGVAGRTGELPGMITHLLTRQPVEHSIGHSYAAVVVVLKANAVGANRRYQPNKKRGRHRHVQSFITQPPCCKVPLLHRIQIL
jgi:hypothetical protein